MKQVVHKAYIMDNAEIIPISNCKRCKHYLSTMLYQLCCHPSSHYKAATPLGVVDIKTETSHTIQHMRSKGPCGPTATLYTPKT